MTEMFDADTTTPEENRAAMERGEVLAVTFATGSDEECPHCHEMGFGRPEESGDFWNCPKCGLLYGDCNAELSHD